MKKGGLLKSQSASHIHSEAYKQNLCGYLPSSKKEEE